MNFKNEVEIGGSNKLVDIPVINGIPIIKKHSMSSKKDVILKRSLDEHLSDDMASKLRKFDNPEDTIIIESESSSKLVIHPLKTIKTYESINPRKDVETINVSAIFKALDIEEKMNNIDKICHVNIQNSSIQSEVEKPKNVVNNDKEKSDSQFSKIVLKMHSKKPVVENKGLFDDSDVEDKEQEKTRKTNSKLENHQSYLKSFQESIQKDKKKYIEPNRDKLKSSCRDSREKERKFRDSKHDNHRENYRNHDRRDSYREKHRSSDSDQKRKKSTEKPDKSRNQNSKLIYTTLGEAIKSHKSHEIYVERNEKNLDLIVKDEYHNMTIAQSTVDLSEQVLEDSFKLSDGKQCSVKDKSKITENLKKLLGRKNSLKAELSISCNVNNDKESMQINSVNLHSKEQLLSSSCLLNSESNSSLSSIVEPSNHSISSVPTFTLEPVESDNKITAATLPHISQLESSNSFLPLTDNFLVASDPNMTKSNILIPTTPILFVKTTNISFKISPKKIQTGNIFSQVVETSSRSSKKTSILPQQDTSESEIISSIQPEVIEYQSQPTFKVPFYVEKKSKKSNMEKKVVNEESVNINCESQLEKSDNIPSAINKITVPEQQIDCTIKQEDYRIEIKSSIINSDSPASIEYYNDGIISEPIQFVDEDSESQYKLTDQCTMLLNKSSSLQLSVEKETESKASLQNGQKCSNTPKSEENNHEVKKENQIFTNFSILETESSKPINFQKDEYKSLEQLKENSNSNEMLKYENKSQSKIESKYNSNFIELNKTPRFQNYFGKSKLSKDDYKLKKRSKSHSKTRKRSKDKSISTKLPKENSELKQWLNNRSNARKRSKDHSKSRKLSKDHSRSRKNSEDSFKSRKRSKYRSRSRKFSRDSKSRRYSKNKSKSRNLSKDHHGSRKHSKDDFKSRKFLRNHSRSREHSKDNFKSRKRSKNHSKSRKLSKDRPRSKKRSKDKLRSKKVSKDYFKSRKFSRDKSKSVRKKSKQRNSSSHSSTSNHKSRKSKHELNAKINSIDSKVIEVKLKPEIKAICLSIDISMKCSEISSTIEGSKSNLLDNSVYDKRTDQINMNIKNEILVNETKDDIDTNKELLITNRTPVNKKSMQLNDDYVNINTVSPVLGSNEQDPLSNDVKFVEEHLENSLNQFMFSDLKADENNTVNIIQPPPPPPPPLQTPISYNQSFYQNIHLNQLTHYNFHNTSQCNSVNTMVPNNVYNNNSYPLTNVFQPSVGNVNEQPSFGNSWFLSNEYERYNTYNQFSTNEPFLNPIMQIPAQFQSGFIDTGFQDVPVQDYNNHYYQTYDEVDQNVLQNSYKSMLPSLCQSHNHQTLKCNSINKKSSTSSLMNEVMDMDLASDSYKSIDSHRVIDVNDQLSDKDDLSSCGDFEYEVASPLDPFEKFLSAPKPKYEHIIETEVHTSALGKRFEYAYLKSTVCNCVPPNPDEIKLGKTACDENCFNRRIKVECNRKCPVYELCTNRRFQEHIYAPFEPFYCTDGKGWGIRSTHKIYPGTFIIEYVGELIDFHEFLNRINQKSIYNHHFIMSIQKDMYIDAGNKGNWSRFVNHSCDPNTVIERWVINGKTRIGFFSKKVIEKNEEITIDYQFQQYGMIEQKCFCNSINCTGVMGKVNEKLQDQIKTSHIRVRKELIQKIITRSSLKDISHVSDMITVIKEERPDRDTFYGFLEVLLRTDSEVCIRAFIECGGLKVITSFLDSVPWNDWSLKLLYLQCLDHFKLKKRTILSSGCTAIQVVEYWSENPRYSLRHCTDEVLPEKDLYDDVIENNGQEFSEETVPSHRRSTVEFTLQDSGDPLENIETEIKDLAINIKQYFANEKEKFYIPKLKIVHSDSMTDLNDSESKSKDSASRASSIQGDYVKSKKRRIRRRCTEVIRKLSKDEFRKLFSERHEKSLIEKTQTTSNDTTPNLSNIDMNSSEVFEVVKKLLSNVIIDEINRLKHSENFATMPVEFQNLDLDKILSDLNIVGHEEIMCLINHNNDDSKTSSASTYSNSSSKSLDDNSKSDLNVLLKKPMGLPPNWNSRRAENGELYYYNIVTKVTQWDIPVYPWDAGEEDPMAYNFGNASNYQITRQDVQIMYEEYKKRYKLQRIEERRKSRLERSIQRKLNLTPGEKNKIDFSKQVFRVVKTVVKPYNTSACKIGRIQHKQDLKFLCEKFADTIIGKEVKLVANFEDLEMNANVKSKIKTYIEKYMANQGRFYKRSSKVKPKSKKLTVDEHSVNDCITNASQTTESNNQLLSDINNSPDFSP